MMKGDGEVKYNMLNISSLTFDEKAWQEDPIFQSSRLKAILRYDLKIEVNPTAGDL